VRKLRAEPIARWLATVAAAIFCAAAASAAPFGCAVGEYEDNRNCDPSALVWVSVAVLVLSIGAARLTHLRAIH
jgi:hypothetical protein